MAEIIIDSNEILSATKYKNGKVCFWVNSKGIVELPPHGDLKNITHIINELEKQLEIEKKAETPFSNPPSGNAFMRKCRIDVLEWVILNIKAQPIVIPASKG